MHKYRTIALLSVCLLGSMTSWAAQRTLEAAKTSWPSQKRVALVIGNAKYQGAPGLRNPVNDAKAMSDSLSELGFEVIEATDATQKEMNRAITSFGSKLNQETVALFFYAGHGLQVKGKNYIIPIDAQIESEAAIASEAVSVDAVLEQLNASPVSIIVLDACRNNPFERSFRKMGGGGLAQMDAPQGSFIAYATAPGKTAADGDGENGLFTQELLKQINESGLDLEKVFKRVRANVFAKSGGAQMPWDSSSMTGDFYFNPGPGGSISGNQDKLKAVAAQLPASIYIYRDALFMVAARFAVSVDGYYVGELADGGFLQVEVPPGSHVISSNVIKGVMVSEGKQTATTVVTESAKSYFYEESVTGGHKLLSVEEASGRKTVGKLSMVAIPKSVIRKIASEFN